MPGAPSPLGPTGPPQLWLLLRGGGGATEGKMEVAAAAGAQPGQMLEKERDGKGELAAREGAAAAHLSLSIAPPQTGTTLPTLSSGCSWGGMELCLLSPSIVAGRPVGLVHSAVASAPVAGGREQGKARRRQQPQQECSQAKCLRGGEEGWETFGQKRGGKEDFGSGTYPETKGKVEETLFKTQKENRVESGKVEQEKKKLGAESQSDLERREEEMDGLTVMKMQVL